MRGEAEGEVDGCELRRALRDNGEGGGEPIYLPVVDEPERRVPRREIEAQMGEDDTGLRIVAQVVERRPEAVEVLVPLVIIRGVQLGQLLVYRVREGPSLGRQELRVRRKFVLVLGGRGRRPQSILSLDGRRM